MKVPVMDLRPLVSKLDAYAKSKGITPQDAFYITGEFKIDAAAERIYSNEAMEYCFTCATALQKRAIESLPKNKQDEHIVCETDLRHEDTCKNCITCGALLDYSLNPTGVASELDHYASIRFRKQLHPGDAFHIARVLEAAPDDRDVMRLAKRAATRIPPISPPPA